MRERDAPGLGVRVNFGHVVLDEQLFAHLVQLFVVEHAKAVFRNAADEDVLCNGQFRDEAQLLIHASDAIAHGVGWGANLCGLAKDLDLAGVGPISTGQHLEQGAFARSVLTQQGVYFAAVAGKGYVLQCIVAVE